MNRTIRPFQLHTICLLAAAAVLAGCGKGSPTQSKLSYKMGDRMQVGPLVYNVLETQWKPQLGDMPSTRIPQNRFLLLRLTITNSGGKDVSVPLLNLEDGKGNTYQELADGNGVTNWMGMLRTIKPAQTEEGWILFDVSPSAYSLRVTDGGEAGSEQSLLIEIPLSMESMNDSLPGSGTGLPNTGLPNTGSPNTGLPGLPPVVPPPSAPR
jgi:hypothetical protein